MRKKNKSRITHLISEIKAVAAVMPEIEFFIFRTALNSAQIAIYIVDAEESVIDEAIDETLSDAEIAEKTSLDEVYYDEKTARDLAALTVGPEMICTVCGKIIRVGEVRIPHHDVSEHGVFCSECFARDFKAFIWDLEEEGEDSDED